MSGCGGGNCGGGGYYPRNVVTSCCHCPDQLNCCPGQCESISLKRHDIKPSFNLAVSDCDGPLNLTDTVVEVNMWAKGKLKTAITPDITQFALADNIGFYQSFPGDIIVVDRIRSPEMMLITGFDEDNSLINVMRGYQGTTPGTYKRGTKLRIFRILNGVGETQTVIDRVEEVDGTKKDVVVEAKLVYNWRPADTCLPGCYQFEFKLLKMLLLEQNINPYVPVPSVGECDIGYGVEWVRRFPLDSDGFIVKINNSPTSESLVT